MTQEIKDIIKSAMDKDASGVQAGFDAAIAPKLDAALSAKYDAMFGAQEAQTDESTEDHSE